MMRWMRRLFWLGVLAAGGCGAYRVWRQRQAAPAAPATWPPLETEPRATSHQTGKIADSAGTDPTPAEPAARWKAPVNGGCPDGYLVKANDNSGIFHVPGGRFYARTVAERCYANVDDAVADGYRPAKA
ncbi:MAG: hypothetical protein ABI706_01685 [Ilumatobacteraceae bacterium]